MTSGLEWQELIVFSASNVRYLLNRLHGYEMIASLFIISMSSLLYNHRSETVPCNSLPDKSNSFCLVSQSFCTLCPIVLPDFFADLEHAYYNQELCSSKMHCMPAIMGAWAALLSVQGVWATQHGEAFNMEGKDYRWQEIADGVFTGVPEAEWSDRGQYSNIALVYYSRWRLLILVPGQCTRGHGNLTFTRLSLRLASTALI